MIKVVMTSTNQAKAPRFKNFRSIALRSLKMNNYIKVESDQSLVRDLDSNAIVNTDKDEYQNS